MPLSLELAAARVDLLQPEALLHRLNRRLQLLTRGAADSPERQQTLRQTLAWSHDLLGPFEQVLFRRLAVFAGGFTLEAAEAICANDSLATEDVLGRLEALVNCSLVHRLAEAEPRFGLLETVREFAQEALDASGETSERCNRHAAYFTALAEEAEPQLRGSEQRIWLDRLDAELDNLRAALAWARSSAQLELGLRLAIALACSVKIVGTPARDVSGSKA